MKKRFINKVTLGILILGIIISIYNFFSMYSIVGKCSTDTDSCSAYKDWVAFSRIGAILVIIGLISHATVLVIEHNKKQNNH